MPGSDSSGSGRSGRSSGAGEDAGQDGDRQHPPGRRRYLKLVCSEVGDCAEGFLLHGAKAFRRCKGKDTCEGSGCADPDEAVKIKEIKIRQIGEDYLMEGMVDRDVYRDH